MLLATMDIPPMNAQMFKSYKRIVDPIIEYVANESCSEAAEMERALTMTNIKKLKKIL